MNTFELKTIGLLSGIYVSRMLGLFLIFPTFSLLAQHYEHATPTNIGFALGAYSLAQAILQIPAGWLSDIIGRKKVLYGGLLLFLIGSLISAMSNDIHWVIAGRIIQGMGAISAVCLAYVGDSIRANEQGKAMMIIGISIGSSFMLAFIFGTLISEHFGLHGVFITTALLSIIALFLVYKLPVVEQKTTTFNWEQLKETLVNGKLFMVNVQVAFLHMTFAACFFLMPLILSEKLPDVNKVWLYVVPLLITVAIVGPCVKNRDAAIKRLPLFWIIFVAALLLLATLPVFASMSNFMIMMTAFFTAFTLIETLLPAQLLAYAQENARGATSGVFSLYQLGGSFTGGILGAKCYSIFSTDGTIQSSFYLLALPALIVVASFYINKLTSR